MGGWRRGKGRRRERGRGDRETDRQTHREGKEGEEGGGRESETDRHRVTEIEGAERFRSKSCCPRLSMKQHLSISYTSEWIKHGILLETK